MRKCSNCEYPAGRRIQYCTRCGALLPDEDAIRRTPVVFDSFLKPVILMVTGAVALAAIAAFSWLGVTPPAPNGGQVRTAQAPATTPDGNTGTGDTFPDNPEGDSSSPTDMPSFPPGPVQVGEDEQDDGTAPPVVAFLDEYFDAINQHDYQSFAKLWASPSDTPSQSTFSSNWGTTQDSDETLVSLSTADDGSNDLIAEVQFASHQSAASSPDDDGDTCDNWDDYLYLTPSGDTYVLDVAPSDSDETSYEPC